MGSRSVGRSLWLAVLVFLAAACSPAVARTVLELDAARQPVRLQDWGDLWLDATGAATAAQVASDDRIAWTPTQGEAVHPLTTGQALWFRFTIPPAPDAERWYLEIPYASLNKATLFTQDGAGQWLPQTAGDTVPVAQWPVPHRHPLLPVAVSAEEPRHFLLRVENPHAFGAPLSFVSESHLSRTEQRTSLILGIYFGLAGLAVLLGVLSAVSLRDAAYGWYALSVALMALSQAALTGIGGLHLWPHEPRWNDLSPMLLPVLSVGALTWFVGQVVSIPERSRRLHGTLAALALLAVAVAAGLVAIPPAHRIQAMVPYITIVSLAGLATVAWAWTRGDRYAPWVLAGFLPVAIGAAFPLARTWGLIPVGFATTHGMQVGIAFELPVMLVILMLRSQSRREHNRRLQRFGHIDPSTGLINEQVFLQRLSRMMARSQRLKYASAVLVVDIVNYDHIRRTFGARSAEELPLQVAGRLLSAAREIDAVARLAPLRFGMLVEGPLSEEDAAAEGPKMVARCLMPFRNKPVDWVAQVRVAQTLVPTGRADARQVVGQLESLLANVQPDSKRAVFTLRS